jgi:hypothetical protein
MSQPTHKLTLGKHTEKVTKDQLEALKARLGTRFSEYEVHELHVAKPADAPTAAEKVEKPTTTKKDKDAEKAA